MKTVNINIVAKEAGVSTATVSRALSGNSSIKESTRQRILKVANRYDYRPSHLARGLMTKRTDTIGLILPELVDEFFMQVVNSIDEEVHKVNNFLMVASSQSQRDTIETMIDFMASGRVDGVLLMAPKIQDRVQYLSRKKAKPVVYLNSCKCENEGVNFTVDNYGGAKSVVKHLISHGYKRIAMIKGPNGNCEADDRALGFRDALIENGINFEDELVIEGDFRANSGYSGFLRLFNRKRKPEAIFAANDMMAVGVFQAARSLGISIPNEVAIAGFDNIYLSKLLMPTLTTVHVPIADLASNAVQYLIKMINGEIPINKSFCTELTTDLVIGASCGCNQKNEVFF